MFKGRLTRFLLRFAHEETMVAEIMRRNVAVLVATAHPLGGPRDGIAHIVRFDGRMDAIGRLVTTCGVLVENVESAAVKPAGRANGPTGRALHGVLAGREA